MASMSLHSMRPERLLLPLPQMALMQQQQQQQLPLPQMALMQQQRQLLLLVVAAHSLKAQQLPAPPLVM